MLSVIFNNDIDLSSEDNNGQFNVHDASDQLKIIMLVMCCECLTDDPVCGENFWVVSVRRLRCSLSSAESLSGCWSSPIRRRLTKFIGRRASVTEWSRCMRLRVTWVISITRQTRSFWQRICTVNIAYLGVRQLLRRRLPWGTISLKWTLLRPLPSIRLRSSENEDRRHCDWGESTKQMNVTDCCMPVAFITWFGFLGL